MYLEVDKFGRVVIPKKLRDRFGFTPGSRLRVRLAKRGGIVLRSEQRSADVLIEENGLWVLNGKIIGDEPRDIVEQVREERDRQVLGLDE